MKKVLQISTCRVLFLGNKLRHPDHMVCGGFEQSKINNKYHLFRTRMFTQNPDYINITIDQIKYQLDGKFAKLYNPNGKWGFCKDPRAKDVVAEINNSTFDKYICEISSLKYRDKDGSLKSYTVDEFIKKLKYLNTLVGQDNIIYIGSLNVKMTDNMIKRLRIPKSKIKDNRLLSRIQLDQAINQVAKHKILPGRFLNAQSNVAELLQKGASTHHYSRKGSIAVREYITTELKKILT